MSATYTKLKNGSWGVRSTTPVAPGDNVLVTKRDQTTKLEIIDHVVWTGEGVWIAAFRSSTKTPAQDRARTPGSRRRRGGGSYECEECGERVSPGSQCWETGCAH